MGVSCEIFIKRAVDGVHVSGQTVTGVIRLTVAEPTWINSIKTSLEGSSKCCFLTGCTYYATEEPTASWQFMEQQILETLEPGSYNYPFDFQLSTDAPSSFDETLGLINKVKVSYFIRAKVNVNRFCKDVYGEKEFLVRGYVVPRAIAIGKPAAYPMSKTLISLCHQKKQEIRVTTSIAQSHVKPGNVLHMLFQIANNTDVDIIGIRSELMRKITMSEKNAVSASYTKTFKECSVQTQCAYANCEALMFSLLRVPDGINTIRGLELLSVEYKVKVTMLLPFPHINASTIITVPIGMLKADGEAT